MSSTPGGSGRKRPRSRSIDAQLLSRSNPRSPFRSAAGRRRDGLLGHGLDLHAIAQYREHQITAPFLLGGARARHAVRPPIPGGPRNAEAPAMGEAMPPNKIFSSAWLDGSVVACGSKDNRLLAVDGQPSRGAWGPEANSGSSMAIDGFVEVDLSRLTSRVPWARREYTRGSNMDIFGNHAVTVSPDRSLLVSATDDPRIMCAMSLPNFEPVAIMPTDKNSGGVFGAEFIGSTHNGDMMVSVSQGGYVDLWQFGDPQLVASETDRDQPPSSDADGSVGLMLNASMPFAIGDAAPAESHSFSQVHGQRHGNGNTNPGRDSGPGDESDDSESYGYDEGDLSDGSDGEWSSDGDGDGGWMMYIDRRPRIPIYHPIANSGPENGPPVAEAEAAAGDGQALLVPRASRSTNYHLRAVAGHPTRGDEFATLASSGVVSLWDVATMSVKHSIAVRASECVCITGPSTLGAYAFGARDSVHLVDPRDSSGRAAMSLPDLNDSLGVRSVVLRGDLLSFAGGLGRISFYDLRSGRFSVPNDPGASETEDTRLGHGGSAPIFNDDIDIGGGFGSLASVSVPTSPALFYVTGGPSRMGNFSNPHAVYTLSFSPDSTRMFAGGGPTFSTSSGMYMSVW